MHVFLILFWERQLTQINAYGKSVLANTIEIFFLKPLLSILHGGVTALAIKREKRKVFPHFKHY